MIAILRRQHSMLGILFLLAVFGCAKKESREEILVKIGDRSISKNEFLQRAELTVRPRNLMDRHHVLNNLVAEKLIAKEFENRSDILGNERYRLYMKGIQEQDMREQLYLKEAYNRARVDSSEIWKKFPLAGREYDLAFYSIRDSAVTGRIEQMLQDSSTTREMVFDGLSDPDNVPRKKVAYLDHELDVIHKALYSEPLQRGQVIGPITIEDNYYLIIKVLGWKEELIIGGGQDFHKRWMDISNKMKDIKAREIWSEYIREIMKGKQIAFNKEVFDQISDMFMAEYTSDQGIDPNALKENDDSYPKQMLDMDAELLQKPFFTIDGKEWTVEDFRKSLISHPLVYRDMNFKTPSGFRKQFQYAIADLVKDHYMTKRAYQKKMDRLPEVKRKLRMWKDAVLARYEVGKFLENLSERKDYDPKLMKGRDNYLNLYIDSLFTKYADEIVLDSEMFDKIQITSVPMFALRRKQPFPIAVPGFPTYTTKINIGKSIQEQE